MGIAVRKPDEIAKIRRAGELLTEAHELIVRAIRPGVTTLELDAIAKECLLSRGAKCSCKGYKGYPNTICASVDDVVVHGIPNNIKLEQGQIVGIDFCASFDGYHADMARTYIVGKAGRNRIRLIDTAKAAFDRALEVVRAGARVGDISGAIQSVIEESGYSAVRAMTGHGIGRKMHEEPAIPNYGTVGTGARLCAGNVLAIEPMLNAGGFGVKFDADGWTCRTQDGSDSAHYENTVLVTETGYELLTG